MTVVATVFIGGAVVLVPQRVEQFTFLNETIHDMPFDHKPIWKAGRRTMTWMAQSVYVSPRYGAWFGQIGVAAAVSLVVWAIVRREARCMRFNRGLCWRCGYSRNGLDREQACPECNAPWRMGAK
jgi:hypothetical protein